MSGVSGKWGSNFWDSFKVNFAIGALGFGIGAIASFAKGGLTSAGFTGLSGYIRSSGEILNGRSFTLGYSNVVVRTADLGHEFGHTLFAVFSAAGGNIFGAWTMYGLSGLPGIIAQDSAYGGGFEDLFEAGRLFH